MSSFFRGRALSAEARRMLSLVNYGRTLAVSEGAPVLLWFDTNRSAYGLSVQAGHTGRNDRAEEFTAEPTLRLEVSAAADRPVSEQDDERLGLPENLPAIRFNPDGFFDEGSVLKIVIRQGDEAALEIVPTANRLGFEILPVPHAN
jgi:hypothetical protein